MPEGPSGPAPEIPMSKDILSVVTKESNEDRLLMLERKVSDLEVHIKELQSKVDKFDKEIGDLYLKRNLKGDAFDEAVEGIIENYHVKKSKNIFSNIPWDKVFLGIVGFSIGTVLLVTCLALAEMIIVSLFHPGTLLH
jgi:hypothetical protein